jgi:hypothetical protein
MGIDTLKKLTEQSVSFSFRKELTSCTKNGLIDFKSSKYNATNTCWDGESLTIPAYGIYKVSWGFKQIALDTFYKDNITELSLVIDHNKYESVAVITKDTPCYYGMKSSSKTTIMLLRENQNLSLHAEIMLSREKKNLFLNAEIKNKKNPKMSDIYFSVLKIGTA